jgi:esterase/lipase superfamily enzyme
MQRETWTWNSPHLPEPARIVRWGHFGTPVLLFPTAGGDFEEVERFKLVDALSGLIDAGRIKVFSVDGIAARAWLRGRRSPDECAKTQRQYDAFIYEEVVPHIRRDCQSDSIEIITAGAAFGAFNAISSFCRHPNVFRVAIALSGEFDLSRYLPRADAQSVQPAQEIGFDSPLQYVPSLEEGSQLDQLRRRFVQVASGQGDYEKPGDSQHLVSTLAARGIPNNLDLWGRDYAHSWNTWRDMLPRYLTVHA